MGVNGRRDDGRTEVRPDNIMPPLPTVGENIKILATTLLEIIPLHQNMLALFLIRRVEVLNTGIILRELYIPRSV